MRIAIVTPYPLLNAGLKHLLRKYFEILPELYDSPRHLLDDTPEQFDAYILFADTLIGYSDFFLPRKNRVILLTAHCDTPSRDSNMPALSLTDSKETLLEKIESFIDQLDRQTEAQSHELSPREAEVLKLVAQGLINKEIAERLNISVNTVLSHRKNLTAKLGIKTVSGLSFYAMMNGYITHIDHK